MKLDRRLLTSKLGQRIITLFFLCALLPIGAVAVISFTQVTSQLQDQIQVRLREASKSRSMAIFERLVVLEGELRMIGSSLDSGAAAFTQGSFDDDFKLRWNVWDGTVSIEFEPFVPTRTFLAQYLPFFGQYANSLSFFSPDGGSFTFAGSIEGRGEGIWVQQVDGGAPAALVAPGEFSTWAP